MLITTTSQLQQKGRSLTSPPPRGAAVSAPSDGYAGSKAGGDPGIYSSAQWAPTGTSQNKARISGAQAAMLGLGVLTAVGGTVGVMVHAVRSFPTAQETVVEHSRATGRNLDLSKTAEQPQKSFSDGRTLLVDRRSKALNHQFDPDPALSAETRGGRPVFEHSVIADLLDRDLTEVPEGAPKFTALDVDGKQMSKIYFDQGMNEVEYGYGTTQSGNFFTRPERMQGQGSGASDQITQYHLSCVYRLEESATIDGVKLEPGVYRLIGMEPSSRVATPGMQRGVCPGHRLVGTDSGFAGDYLPTQKSPDGRTLHVNPDDILQIWTLTPEEAATYSAE